MECQISQIFPALEPEKIQKLKLYAELLTAWNAKINLVSRKDIKNIIPKHIIPSLAISKIADIKRNDNILDIGTGGGLPGIPLAIVHEKTHFTLLDSVGKKIAAVEDMVKNLSLMNVKAINSRAENFQGQFSKIVARAVTNVPAFLKYSEKLLAPEGRIFYLKGGSCGDDLKLLKNYKLHKIAALTGIGQEDDKIILEIFNR